MGKRVYYGYMTKGERLSNSFRKRAFEVGAGSKKDAHKQMKESHPLWRIFVKGYKIK